MLDSPDRPGRRHPPVQKTVYAARDDGRDAVQHRRHLTLIRAACVGLALAAGIGLPLAWQIDRWLADWHYEIEDDHYILPEAEQQPGAFAGPEMRL
ncbi:MAG: hypothetical protein QM699_01535 [Amaricoccus sp.]|uniref:hypothetical protein n=1 Tax=Amaricoccus sp. TaxID=1872485 RepID=UPI0039E631B1